MRALSRRSFFSLSGAGAAALIAPAAAAAAPSGAEPPETRIVYEPVTLLGYSAISITQARGFREVFRDGRWERTGEIVEPVHAHGR